ncbi:DUF4374 domain-containing protein [Dyadobacter psychrotolerans]|nr:DUF4374 domain-containing protein [Dyadobacter psychrotolerans]
MFKTIQKFSISAAIFLAAVYGMSACKSDSESGPDVEPEVSNYVLYGATGTPAANYMLRTKNLATGTISSVGNGIELTGKLRDMRWVIRKNREFYNLDDAAKKLSKYKLEDNAFTTVSEIPFTHFTYLIWSQWLDDNTLLLGGNSEDGQTTKYVIVNTATFTITKTGDFALPKPTKGKMITACAGIIKDAKLHLTYSYTDDEYTNGSYSSDTSYLAVMDYPSLANLKLSKDTRSAFPGTARAGAESAFVYNNDIYIVTSPIAWNGDNTVKPTGIYRIKNGETTFDKDYFFNLSKLSNNNDPDGLLYLGDGKIFARNYRDENVTTWADWSKPIVEYMFIDLAKQTIKKMDLPLSYGASTTYVYENNKIYFQVKTDADGVYIYEYNVAADKLTKGLKVDGLSTVTGLFKLTE